MHSAVRRRGSGMTLVEMLVTLSILGFFAAGAVGVLASAKASWQASVGQTDVRQALQVGTYRMAEELRDSHSAFLTDNTRSLPPALAFPSAYDAQGRFVTGSEGQPVWQKYVLYYIPAGTDRLLRRELFTVPADPSEPAVLTAADVAGACNGQGTLVSSGARALGLAPGTGESTWLLTLTVEGRNPNGRIESLSRTVAVFMRN